MVANGPGARGSAEPSDPAGPTGQLATWLARTTLADIPAEVRSRARYLLLDGVGCLLVGAQLPWSRTGVEAVTALDGEGASMIAGWGKTTSAPSAAMLNSSFIQGFELDDYFPPAPLHANSIVLPALMAAAGQKPDTTGAQFLLGAILGYEVGPRVGLALHGPQMLSRGWHSGVVFGPPAAAAAAGSLYGLTAAGFEDALGIAATQSCGLMSAQFESMVKRMQHGFAARNGLYAAALASGGYVGIKRVFERGYGGFLSVFGEGHDPDPDQIAAWGAPRDTLGHRALRHQALRRNGRPARGHRRRPGPAGASTRQPGPGQPHPRRCQPAGLPAWRIRHHPAHRTDHSPDEPQVHRARRHPRRRRPHQPVPA
jgi:aconitate decarboxylase